MYAMKKRMINILRGTNRCVVISEENCFNNNEDNEFLCYSTLGLTRDLFSVCLESVIFW